MELYQRYGPALRRKCERMLGNTEEAEDVVQTLFMDLLRKGRSDVDLAYLYRAATSRSLNRIRDRKRRARLLEQHGDSLRGAGAGAPDEQTISRDLLLRLMAGLDRKSAEILIYTCLDAMTQQEVADLMSTSRRTVGKRLRRIKQTMAEITAADATEPGWKERA